MGRTRGFVELSAKAHELGIPHSRVFRVWGWDRDSDTERPGLYLRDLGGDVHRLGTDEAEALETLATLVGKVPEGNTKSDSESESESESADSKSDSKPEAAVTDALRGGVGRRRNPVPGPGPGPGPGPRPGPGPGPGKDQGKGGA